LRGMRRSSGHQLQELAAPAQLPGFSSSLLSRACLAARMVRLRRKQHDIDGRHSRGTLEYDAGACRNCRPGSARRDKTCLDNPAGRSQLFVSIRSWAQALANLPSRARWFPEGDAARSATKRVARVSSPPRYGEGAFLCLESTPLKSPPARTRCRPCTVRPFCPADGAGFAGAAGALCRGRP